jgi:cell wall-associated NlpC family hydrolase
VVALAQVGKPYVYGGAGPNSFDCSGLVMYAWAAAGVSLPHYSVSQYSGTARITEAELEPGDIVFYDNESGPQPGHEALYIGNGQVVAANTTGTDVQTQSITYDGTPMGFGRVA